VTEPGLVLALDAETQMDGTTLVRLASRISPDWLLELFFDAIEETDTHELNAEGRVVRFRRLLYQGIVFEERVPPAVEPAAAARLLVDRLRASGGSVWPAEPALDRLQARLAFAAAHVPEAGLKPFTDDDVWAAVEELCLGCVTLEEVRQALQRQRLSALLLARLTPAQRARLDDIAPENLPLGRRRVSIGYPADGPPFIAAPIQDSSGSKKPHAWPTGAFPSPCTCWHPIGGRFRSRPIWLASGNGPTVNCARNLPGAIQSMPSRKWAANSE
jgi:hypothetical protein